MKTYEIDQILTLNDKEYIITGISVREFCKKYMTPEEYQREFLSEKDIEE